MSPAAGGAAPTQPAAASFDPAPAPTAAIGAPPQQPENLRDPGLQAEGPDPGNAAARKPAWNVPPPPAAPVGGGIMGGDESWPALTESAAAAAAARAWPKSASSDSLSDGSSPSAPEDLVVVPSVPSQPVSNPISTAPSPVSASPPPSATTTAPSPQNGGPSQPDLVRHGGGHGGNNGEGGHGGSNGGADHGGSSGGGGGGNGSTRSRSTGNNSSDGNSSSGGDGNWNDEGLGGVSNMNSSVHSSGTGGSGIDSSRRVFGSNNWNSNGRGGRGGSGGGGGYNNGSGDEGYRNHGGSRGGGHWNNNGRSGSGSSNGFGGRGGRNRRDHDRGGNFSPRNYSRALPAQQQQQQPGFYQPGPFQRPPPPPPAAHFMMPQPYVPYVPPFAYPGDVQNYPFYVTPLEQQFQNMHLIQQPMQPLGAQQDQLSLQHDIQHQIEHYFSTNNLCHDTHLRGHMDDQGWVPMDLIASFPKVTRFLMLGVDTNYILDSLQGSELVEVQGNNIRRRNDWAAWLLHRRTPPSN